MSCNPSAGVPISYAPNDPIYAIYDFEMPVGTTGIIFVVALNGTLGPPGIGPIFTPNLIAASYRRAATSLVHMGLIGPQTFAFIRQAVPMTQAECAAFLPVSLPTLMDWETGVQPVTRDGWLTLAELICQRDDRALTGYLALQPDFGPRKIRITIDYSS